MCKGCKQRAHVRFLWPLGGCAQLWMCIATLRLLALLTSVHIDCILDAMQANAAKPKTVEPVDTEEQLKQQTSL